VGVESVKSGAFAPMAGVWAIKAVPNIVADTMTAARAMRLIRGKR
jgi:hypothetical protein